MRRLPVDAWPAEAARLRLPQAASHHARVLRLGPGSRVELFDGEGRSAPARVLDWEGDQLWVELEHPPRQAAPEPDVALHLLQAMPKSSKLEDIVRQVTEVGVTAVHLVETRRSVVRWPPAKTGERLARLERIATQACRQSGRAHAPRIAGPAALEAVLRQKPAAALGLACVPGRPALVQTLSDAAHPGAIWVLVGPEGGLDPREIELAERHGFRAGALGAHVLRVETAAVVAVALAVQAWHGRGREV